MVLGYCQNQKLTHFPVQCSNIGPRRKTSQIFNVILFIWTEVWLPELSFPLYHLHIAASSRTKAWRGAGWGVASLHVYTITVPRPFNARTVSRARTSFFLILTNNILSSCTRNFWVVDFIEHIARFGDVEICCSGEYADGREFRKIRGWGEWLNGTKQYTTYIFFLKSYVSQCIIISILKNYIHD